MNDKAINDAISKAVGYTFGSDFVILPSGARREFDGMKG